MSHEKLTPYPHQKKVESFQLYYIDTQHDLQLMLDKIKNTPEIAVDIEFDRNRHHYDFSLCLIQIACDDSCYIIDPLQEGVDALSIKKLNPLWKVFENPAIIKIFHSPSEDIRLLKTLNCYIKNIFDTHTAAQLTSTPTFSYKHLLETRLQINLEKNEQTSDWKRRPLSPFQLQYAAKDVIYLFELKKILLQEVTSLHRLNWLQEELLHLETLEIAETDNLHLRIKGAKDLTDLQRHQLKALFDYRDKQAQKLNKPPYQTIEDGILMALVERPKDTIAQWTSLKRKHPRLQNAIADIEALLQQAIQEAQALGLSNRPYYPTQAEKQAALDRRDQLRRCKDFFKPIRDHIQQQYGESIAALVLTVRIIEDFCWERYKLSHLKQYAQNIIRQAAADIGTDLSQYE